MQTLVNVLYAGNGLWRECNAPGCRTLNSDWGADSATYTLYLRWALSQDPKIPAMMTSLLGTSRRYPGPCAGSPCAAWSDTPAWDAVAYMREYQVLNKNPQALAGAKAALRYVQGSAAFSGGACADVPYQLPQPSASAVKTLETGANVIKADILVYAATRDRSYLDDALTRYASARAYYLVPDTSLYTVHVIDDGTDCEQVDRRFFASVNGDMIWNGLELWRITHERRYYNDAFETASAVNADLSDDLGVFADMQGENDVVEPLVEAMYDLAQTHVAFARGWILKNARAALGARAPDGTFARFFDGPPQTDTSLWQSNGGLALEIVAAGLAPHTPAVQPATWQNMTSVVDSVSTLPATISIDGSGIALVGTMSEACQKGHVRVFIDGVETYDHTGLWQNQSMPGGNSVLFAWRWRTPGRHTIRLEPTRASQTGEGVLNLQAVVTAPAVYAAGARRAGVSHWQAPRIPLATGGGATPAPACRLSRTRLRSRPPRPAQSIRG